jgi:hypothetical protein
VREESAVAGRESAVPRADLCDNGIMSSNARELAERTLRAKSEARGGDYTKSRGEETYERMGPRGGQKHHVPCPLSSTLHWGP